MTAERWRDVDGYLTGLLAPSDAALDAALAASDDAGLPQIAVSPPLGKLLQLLARSHSARTILEIGTLGGYSTIWLARALPEGGRLTTLEVEPRHAAVAGANLERAGLADVVEIRIGPAQRTLSELAGGSRTFDLIFIDADKPAYPEYLRWSMRVAHPGTLIVADNVVRGGAVADAASEDPNVVGARRFLEVLAAEPRLSATVIQTVGSKGYDGFAIALVDEEPR
ncbi:MAG: O-methyltransferase [Actinomycetota bacterium]